MSKVKFTDCVSLTGSAPGKFESEKKYVSTGALDTDHIDESQVEIVSYESRPSRANLEVHSGDILFAKMQGTNKSIIIDEETEKNLYSTGFCAVHAKDNVLSKRCLYYLVTGENFLRQKDKNCSGATQKAITNSGLKKIMISIPERNIQDDIANRLDEVQAAISVCKKQLSLLDELVKSRHVGEMGVAV